MLARSQKFSRKKQPWNVNIWTQTAAKELCLAKGPLPSVDLPKGEPRPD